jgi:hypothetical protein
MNRWFPLWAYADCSVATAQSHADCVAAAGVVFAGWVYSPCYIAKRLAAALDEAPSRWDRLDCFSPAHLNQLAERRNLGSGRAYVGRDPGEGGPEWVAVEPGFCRVSADPRGEPAHVFIAWWHLPEVDPGDAANNRALSSEMIASFFAQLHLGPGSGPFHFSLDVFSCEPFA